MSSREVLIADAVSVGVVEKKKKEEELHNAMVIIALALPFVANREFEKDGKCRNHIYICKNKHKCAKT